MMEDKLDHDERLRLECLAQSIAAHHAMVGQGRQGIIDRAKEFEQYVKGEAKR